MWYFWNVFACFDQFCLYIALTLSCLLHRQPDVTGACLKGLGIEFSQRPSAKSIRYHHKMIFAFLLSDICQGLPVYAAVVFFQLLPYHVVV